jgi:hypothetical protein
MDGRSNPTRVARETYKTKKPPECRRKQGEKGKEPMSTLRRLLVCIEIVDTLLSAGVSFVSGLPRKTTIDPDKELRDALKAWARSGREVASSTLRSADQD